MAATTDRVTRLYPDLRKEIFNPGDGMAKWLMQYRQVKDTRPAEEQGEQPRNYKILDGTLVVFERPESAPLVVGFCEIFGDSFNLFRGNLRPLLPPFRKGDQVLYRYSETKAAAATFIDYVDVEDASKPTLYSKDIDPAAQQYRALIHFAGKEPNRASIFRLLPDVPKARELIGMSPKSAQPVKTTATPAAASQAKTVPPVAASAAAATVAPTRKRPIEPRAQSAAQRWLAAQAGFEYLKHANPFVTPFQQHLTAEESDALETQRYKRFELDEDDNETNKEKELLTIELRQLWHEIDEDVASVDRPDAPALQTEPCKKVRASNLLATEKIIKYALGAVKQYNAGKEDVEKINLRKDMIPAVAIIAIRYLRKTILSNYRRILEGKVDADSISDKTKLFNMVLAPEDDRFTFLHYLFLALGENARGSLSVLLKNQLGWITPGKSLRTAFTLDQICGILIHD